MQVLSGAGKPAASLGDTDDCYVDTTALILYKKSDHCTWASVATLGVDATARLASGTAFTQGVGGNWTGATATSAAALDQLASRVKALEP